MEGVKLHSRGKVRDMYDLGDRLLMVSTDRISAFDFVLPNGIPDKGRVLTGLSLFWFDILSGIVTSHLVTADVTQYPPELAPWSGMLQGRSMIVKRANMFPVECVVRGYLAGSGYKEYTETGAVSGNRLPAGLRLADRLPELIFTPATKAETGHDENITFGQMAGLIGDEHAERLKSLSVAIFRKADEVARKTGIIIADTKFEFGLVDDRIVLADEALTPDSSRFWDMEEYRPGSSPASFDKQYVRDYLESIGWNKQPPVPQLPEEIVQGTRRRYLEIYQKLTGRKLEAAAGIVAGRDGPAQASRPSRLDRSAAADSKAAIDGFGRSPRSRTASRSAPTRRKASSTRASGRRPSAVQVFNASKLSLTAVRSRHTSAMSQPAATTLGASSWYGIRAETAFISRSSARASPWYPISRRSRSVATAGVSVAAIGFAPAMNG